MHFIVVAIDLIRGGFMFAILESLVNLLLAFIKLILDLIQPLIYIIEFVFTSISSILFYGSYMPDWLYALFCLGLIVLFIKFGLNIHKGGANNG